MPRTNEEILNDSKKGVDSLLEYKRGKLTRTQIDGHVSRLMDEAREAEKERHCNWKRADYGMFGIPDYEYATDCKQRVDATNITTFDFCPYCGGKIKTS